MASVDCSTLSGTARTIMYYLFREPTFTYIDQATNREELYFKLENIPVNFVVVHQPLITDISLLPESHFVILTQKRNEAMLIAVNNHGGCYFLDNPLPIAMLLAVLDPTGVSWAPAYIARAGLPYVHTILTDHEQIILALWNEGFASIAIAGKMFISNGTVKKELENIRTKLREHHILAMMRKGKAKLSNIPEDVFFIRL